MEPNQMPEEYHLRLTVALLRRQVYAVADPTSPAELVDELDAAERELAELERRRAEALTERTAEALAPPLASRIDSTADRGFRVRGRSTTELEATAVLLMAQVPTGVYHLFDRERTPLVACRIRNWSDRTRRLRVTSYLEGYSARAVDTVELDPNLVVELKQLPTLFAERVAQLTELTSATLNVLVEDLDGGAVELHRTRPVPVLPRTTVPMWVKNPETGRWDDFSDYLGAFVTPNAPDVLAFLRTVAEHMPDRVLRGYAAAKGEPREVVEARVEAHVRAVFDALREAGIVYVDSTVAFSPDEGTSTQRVRLPRESLANRSANCVDGAVLAASLLEALAMNPAIVVVPGHAFLGWESRRSSGEWCYLETTMIGGGATFENARAAGEKLAARYSKQADDTGNPQMFRRWPLSTLRAERGITPME